MKATMDANGMITLKAESSLEAYALKKWMDSAWICQEDIKRARTGHWSSGHLCVDARNPEEAKP